jgi:ribonuclease VapC
LIVLDSSALIAILKQEEDAVQFQSKLIDATELFIGAPTKFELLLVMSRWQQLQAAELARSLLDAVGAKVVDWDDEMASIALEAEFRFGKGRHPAALNFGDCMAYAVAKLLDAPLLFKGNDFAQTDIRSAL